MSKTSSILNDFASLALKFQQTALDCVIEAEADAYNDAAKEIRDMIAFHMIGAS